MALLKLTTTLILLSLLVCLASAFQPQIPPITSSLSWQQVEKPMMSAVFSRPKNRPALQNQRNDNDNNSKQTGSYTKVEDGSPLGVAIVVLGGSLVVFGGDNFENIPVWAVFVVASTAAGVARLIRYLQEEKWNGALHAYATINISPLYHAACTFTNNHTLVQSTNSKGGLWEGIHKMKWTAGGSPKLQLMTILFQERMNCYYSLIPKAISMIENNNSRCCPPFIEKIS